MRTMSVSCQNRRHRQSLAAHCKSKILKIKMQQQNIMVLYYVWKHRQMMSAATELKVRRSIDVHTKGFANRDLNSTSQTNKYSWHAISTKIPIIHLQPTDSAIVQPRYCQQAGLSSLRCQSLEQSPCTSHPSTVAHSFRQRLKTSLFWGSSPNLIIWHSELTFCSGPSSNFVIQATLKMSLMIFIVVITNHRSSLPSTWLQYTPK